MPPRSATTNAGTPVSTGHATRESKTSVSRAGSPQCMRNRTESGDTEYTDGHVRGGRQEDDPGSTLWPR